MTIRGRESVHEGQSRSSTLAVVFNIILSPECDVDGVIMEELGIDDHKDSVQIKIMYERLILKKLYAFTVVYWSPSSPIVEGFSLARDKRNV